MSNTADIKFEMNVEEGLDENPIVSEDICMSLDDDEGEEVRYYIKGDESRYFTFNSNMKNIPKLFEVMMNDGGSKTLPLINSVKGELTYELLEIVDKYMKYEKQDDFFESYELKELFRIANLLDFLDYKKPLVEVSQIIAKLFRHKTSAQIMELVNK